MAVHNVFGKWEICKQLLREPVYCCAKFCIYVCH
ncbi:hypothetical protein BVRB_6g150220 [Beta vulgaris subsp. vulgaris]|nr:hypothetical protein BVRB_6g150220 [Beta vulgaris subsp. vulgaris]